MKLVKALGLFVVFGALIVSCGRLKEKPVVDFAMKDFKVESTPNCGGKDSACAIFEVQYPVFLSLDSNVRSSIQERIASIMSDSQGEVKSLEQVGADFIQEFNQFMKETPEYGMSWYQTGRAEVMVASDTLISLQVSVESFTGGASTLFSVRFVNIDPQTGTHYLLDALLRPGYEEELRILAEEDAREQLNVFESDSIPGIDDFGDFKLNDNYGFRKEGIVFYFTAEDVPSVADGYTEILIPYEKLQGWIK